MFAASANVSHPTLLRPRLARLGARLLVACALIASVSASWAASFGLDDVGREAQTLAQSPWKKPLPLDAKRANLDYDDYRKLRHRPDRAWWRAQKLPFQLQFFTTGRTNSRALRLHEIVDGKSQPLIVRNADFDFEGVLSEPAQAAAPIAGWRVTYPLHKPDLQDEVAAFLGSSYFRAIGKGQRYGLSARSLAIDTTGAPAGAGEEFPDLVAYWFERPQPDARKFTFYALLDGPRVAGAYRFVVTPGLDTTVEVRARLFLRSPVATFGIAPLTSMYLHGENQPSPIGDFRPEVHDSDGLQILTAEGEWLWRPLTNPGGTFVTSFTLQSPRGFGLMQRDREFANYEDVEARYELRPSAWIEPVGDWGAGRIELLQFRTPDETHDNIAAYWVPAAMPAPGTPIDIAWRVRWQGSAQRLPPGAYVAQTRTGYGYSKVPPPQQRRKFVIDFAAPSYSGAKAAALEKVDAPVEAIASASTNASIVRINAYPNAGRGGWRATVEFDRLDPKQAVELRVFLRQGANTLSETWSYALAPD
jgi:periplasmic glucans biosynthesis protein